MLQGLNDEEDLNCKEESNGKRKLTFNDYNCDPTRNFTNLKLVHVFLEEQLTSKQIEEIYSGQPFAIWQ